MRYFVPPYLLEQVARADDAELAGIAQRTLVLDAVHRASRAAGPPAPAAPATTQPHRTVSTAGNAETLPGDLVRSEGDKASGDDAVDEAYEGLGATFELFLQVYGRDSLDGRGRSLDATVHYGQDYDNAFWNGERMVFGDGDGRVFERFTKPLTVVGHELTHGVTELTVGLTYQGQSGALNESVSDVFGALVEQHAAGQTADQASWLIGAGLFTPQVHGVALRSMKAPGTAYDDPTLGKDPQPATMDGYVDTPDDNGGVHTNSGIPNHAFYLVADALGGKAWERAGQVWYDTITGGTLSPDADFAAFAKATAAAASDRYGTGDVLDAVREGWTSVGVVVS